MPKKSTTVRGGAQRNKPKVQKSFELVKPTATSSTNVTDSVDSTDEQELVEVGEVDVTTSDVSTPASAPTVEAPVDEMSAPTSKQLTRKPRETTLAVASPVEAKPSTPPSPVETKATAPAAGASTPPKGSASARLAARRKAIQKVQQRAAASLITSEHYTYVRRDLRFIAILAAIMFAVIIILHFVPGIGS